MYTCRSIILDKKVEGERKIENKILKMVQDVTNNQINLESNLVECLDSIKFIQLIVQIEQIYDFEFDDDILLLTAFPNMQSLIDYVKFRTGQ